MKRIILIVCFLVSYAFAQDTWRYHLDYRSETKLQGIDLVFRKSDGLDFLKDAGLGSAFPIFDFVLSNQQHLVDSDWKSLAIDYSLTSSIRLIKPSYQKFFVDLVRFGLEVFNEDLGSRTFTRGQKTLELEIRF